MGISGDATTFYDSVGRASPRLSLESCARSTLRRGFRIQRLIRRRLFSLLNNTIDLGLYIIERNSYSPDEQSALKHREYDSDEISEDGRSMSINIEFFFTVIGRRPAKEQPKKERQSSDRMLSCGGFD